MKRFLTVLAILQAAALAVAVPVPAGACVGRTLYVGYFDSPDQLLVANMLAVFIDERTGTTVKLTRFATRDEAFEALKADRISIYADYSGIILGKLGGTPAPEEEKNLARLKETLNRRHNVVWLEPFGYNRYFSDRAVAGRDPGPAGVMLCKDALAKFPALPRLLAKLRGTLDNDTMASLLRETEKGDPKAVARRFLKSKKLV